MTVTHIPSDIAAYRGIKQPHAKVTVTDIATWHPNSVYASLLSNADWLSKCNITQQAKQLTRLKGREFRVAVQRILTGVQHNLIEAHTHENQI
jgi:hypothetical protein